ncbi:MAG: M16 family metallopeptidase [Chitinophagales bacterium]
MVQYKRFCLENGLRVIVHEDASTPLAVVNIMYDVGARDESPDKTGMAHLFEHLMFSGSKNIKNFDNPLYEAGGESNAFTGSDVTNYYDTLPAHNLETAFWLESDRMMELDFNQKSLEVQQGVVCEEFKENYINQPYGDVWHKLRALCYQSHPYQWPVIGKSLQQIQDVSLDDIKEFFYQHYRPNRAVLVVAGGVKADEVHRLAQKWFGDIPTGTSYVRQLPVEAPQTTFRSLTVEADVPLDALYMAFHTCNRYHENYPIIDTIAEMFSSGQSSRLYNRLVKGRQLFSNLSAYITEDFDNGLFFIYGKLSKGITTETAEAAIWEELEDLKNNSLEEHELNKVKNKMESAIVFSEASNSNKAYHLAYFELKGNIEEINTELHQYTAIEAKDIHRVAKEIFRRENCSTVYYHAQEKE